MSNQSLYKALDVLREKLEQQQNESDRAQFDLAQQVDRINTRTNIGVYKRDVIEEIIGNHTNQIIGMWFRKNLWAMIVAMGAIIVSIFTPLGTMMYYKSSLDTAALDIKELKEARLQSLSDIERIRAALSTEITTLTTKINASIDEGGRDKDEILSQIQQINTRINNLDLVISRIKGLE